MAATLEQLVQDIKERLDIVEVVSEKVILKKRGGQYWGLCPFHKEKTPSFSVNPRLGIYKCFGCGAGGDALQFIMKTENRDFMDVITELAERFGLEMPSSRKNTGSKELKEEMMAACQKAAEFYNTYLLQDKSSETLNVLEYLSARGINKDIINKYTLGFASQNHTKLYDILKVKYSDDVLEKAGLILKSQGHGITDRFRRRIIIPIQNEYGDFVAFGARAIENGQNPKYLNSSDSLIYNKSKLLFGLYTAKEAIKRDDKIILMEGYFDVISAQAHGIENAVAACGTSLTAEHIKLLSRYSKSRKIYLAFDTDTAGQKATARNAELIKQAFQGLGNIKQFDESYVSASDDRYACEIRVIAPPEGKDPDEFIRSAGAESYKKYMEHAPLLIDFQINSILKDKSEIKTPTDKTRFIKQIIPILSEINNEIIQSEYIKIVANTLNINSEALYNEIKRVKTLNSTHEINLNNIVKKDVSISEKAQKNLLSVFLVTDCRYSFEQIKEMIGDIQFTDEMLINVKSTIDKLTCTVNNVKELIEKLYTAYLENPEIQSIITDLISISETFNNLDDKDFKNIIYENINKIIQCQKDEEKEKMRLLYNRANDNETEALKIQMQLRDKINNRLKLEKMND